MSLPKYAEYKDSGVAWLGEMPAHWLITKTKHVSEFSTGWTPPTGDASAYEGSNLWANISDLGPKCLSDTVKRISDKAVRDAGIRVSPLGSLLFSFKLSVGQVSVAGVDMYTNEAIATFRASLKLVIGYAYYAFPILLIKNASENIYGAKLLNQELIKSAFIPLPPVEEQYTIAAFLDRETGKIDALIADQEKLLTLLAEKRQATISHAVTRGLDPNAPMKDSGALWLGEVPSHWNVTKLKFATSLIVDCPHETPVYDEAGPYKVIRTADITAGILDSSEMYSVTEDEYQNRIRRQALFVDDIVYGREGERWGFAALVPTSKSFCLGQRMMQFRVSSSFNSEFLMWQLNTLNVYRQGQMDAVGATSPHVNVGTIRDYILTEPSLDEQIEIAVFLATEVSKVDKLKVEAECAITLLRERRSALISAAVTGKIDVRHAA